MYLNLLLIMTLLHLFGIPNEMSQANLHGAPKCEKPKHGYTTNIPPKTSRKSNQFILHMLSCMCTELTDHVNVLNKGFTLDLETQHNLYMDRYTYHRKQM